MFKRRDLWLGAVGLVGLSLAALPLSASAQARGDTAYAQYANHKAHYTMSYPATWTKLSNKDLDLFVAAPDQHAFLTASATAAASGSMTGAQIAAQQRKVLLGDHVTPSTITHEVRDINGVVFQISEGVTTQTAHHQALDMIILDALHGGYLYDFGAGVILKLHGTATQITQLQHSLNSIAIHS